MAVPTRLVIANWKLNPNTVGTAKELFLALRKEASRRHRVETVIAAPFPYLAELRKLTTGVHTKLGAQDVFWEKSGTYTGEVSVPMLASVGVSHVLIGHSERRALGETDDDVARKAAATVRGGLTAVVCVGETARDTHGQYLSVVETQVQRACADIPKPMLTRLVIAYEPVWAISGGDGKGETATPTDVHEMVIFIRRILTGRFGRSAAARVPILYGGSVSDENAAPMLTEGMVDGLLVGGASLTPRPFAAILSAANEQH